RQNRANTQPDAAPAITPDSSVPTVQPRASRLPQPNSTPPSRPRSQSRGAPLPGRKSPAARALAQAAITRPMTNSPLFDSRVSLTTVAQPEKPSSPSRRSGSQPRLLAPVRSYLPSSAVTPSGATRK